MSDSYKNIAKKLIPMLEKRNFDVYYCENGGEAADKAMSLIDKNDSVSWGGSYTVSQIGLIEKLRTSGYNLIDREKGGSAEERAEIMRQGLLADTFLMSSNAVTEDGILVNIDGNGNRVAAMCFGPKSVIMIIGMNKVCPTLEEAEDRAHNIAAVKNAERFGLTKTGCAHGKCVNCLSDECMCTYIVKTRRSKEKGRIKIILVGESLGF